MTSYGQTHHLSPRLWTALAVTLFAGLVAVLASFNLYLLEDGNPLTTAAYTASPLLRFSYDGAYISALAAVVAVCTIVGYALVRRDLGVVGLIVVSLLVAF